MNGTGLRAECSLTSCIHIAGLWWEVSLLLASFPDNPLNSLGEKCPYTFDSSFALFLYLWTQVPYQFPHPALAPPQILLRNILRISAIFYSYHDSISWISLRKTQPGWHCITSEKGIFPGQWKEDWLTISALRNGSPAADGSHTGSATRPAGTSLWPTKKRQPGLARAEPGQLTHLQKRPPRTVVSSPNCNVWSCIQFLADPIWWMNGA